MLIWRSIMFMLGLSRCPEGRSEMTKHIADNGHSEPGTARIRQYTRIEREAVPNPKTKKLQTRPEAREESARLKAYVEIERGKQA